MRPKPFGHLPGIDTAINALGCMGRFPHPVLLAPLKPQAQRTTPLYSKHHNDLSNIHNMSLVRKKLNPLARLDASTDTRVRFRTSCISRHGPFLRAIMAPEVMPTADIRMSSSVTTAQPLRYICRFQWTTPKSKACIANIYNSTSLRDTTRTRSPQSPY